MHAPVGDALFRALPSHGVSCLRFNFRGVEGSEGSHDEGIGEQLDVAAAIEALSESVDEQLPLFVSGWSFGADMALASDAERVAGWIGVAPPLRMLEPEAYRSGADNRPKLLLVPEHDQFNPPSSATERTSEWNQTSIVTVPQADHFLAGKLSVVVDEAASFILTNT